MSNLCKGCLHKLPWYQQLALLDKLHTREEHVWCTVKSVENGWSRNLLVMQIETRLHQRQGSAVPNFAVRLLLCIPIWPRKR